MSTINAMATDRRAALPQRVADALDRMVATLVERFDPDQIILFGSYARGTAGPDSDIDLLVVMPFDEQLRGEKTREVYAAVSGSRIATQTVVYTPRQFNEYHDVVGTVVYPAVREGVVLYRRQASQVREEPRAWDQAGVVKQLVRMWAESAEHDWRAVTRLSLDEPMLTDIICFHAQQSAEKYLKTMLVARQVPFGKTHKFEEIVALVPADVQIGISAEELKVLEPCAVDVRYPPEPPIDLQAAMAEKVRARVRTLLAESLDG
jgi:HEPN domain-containing protein